MSSGHGETQDRVAERCIRAFEVGYDTIQIASFCRLTEWEVYNAIGRIRMGSSYDEANSRARNRRQEDGD